MPFACKSLTPYPSLLGLDNANIATIAMQNIFSWMKLTTKRSSHSCELDAKNRRRYPTPPLHRHSEFKKKFALIFSTFSWEFHFQSSFSNFFSAISSLFQEPFLKNFLNIFFFLTNLKALNGLAPVCDAHSAHLVFSELKYLNICYLMSLKFK